MSADERLLSGACVGGIVRAETTQGVSRFRNEGFLLRKSRHVWTLDSEQYTLNREGALQDRSEPQAAACDGGTCTPASELENRE